MARPPAELTVEIRCRALRHAIWIALLHAQELGFAHIEGQLTSLLIDVDQRREDLEDDADEIAGVSAWFGPEVAQRYAALLTEKVDRR